MAVLPENERDQIHRGIMRWWSRERELTPFLSPELRTAIAETDDWIEANQTAFNNALSEPFRSNASLAQKTLLFCAVAAMRVSPQFATRLFDLS